MTAIPAQLVAADDTKAILLTLEEFKRHDLTLNEARSDLEQLADGHADREMARQLVAYLDGMLHHVAENELTSEAAARDIQSVIAAVISNDLDPLPRAMPVPAE
jgi:hypothetical protein